MGFGTTCVRGPILPALGNKSSSVSYSELIFNFKVRSTEDYLCVKRKISCKNSFNVEHF